MVTAREPPIVPGDGAKLAPLLGHPPEASVDELHVPAPTGRISGIVVALPVPFAIGQLSRFSPAVPVHCWWTGQPGWSPLARRYSHSRNRCPAPQVQYWSKNRWFGEFLSGSAVRPSWLYWSGEHVELILHGEPVRYVEALTERKHPTASERAAGRCCAGYQGQSPSRRCPTDPGISCAAVGTPFSPGAR